MLCTCFFALYLTFLTKSEDAGEQQQNSYNPLTSILIVSEINFGAADLNTYQEHRSIKNILPWEQIQLRLCQNVAPGPPELGSHGALIKNTVPRAPPEIY